MKYKGLDIAQQPAEFQAWKERVAAINPETYLEIGSLNGGTLLLVADALAEGAVIIAVDVIARRQLVQTLAKLKDRGFETHLIIGDSTAPEMSGKIANILQGRWLDAAFIDGDHTFACVMSDYRLCLKMIRQGGLMGFHDIATTAHSETALFHSVDVFWEWAKMQQHPNWTTEYVVELPKKRPACGSLGNGIGVIEV